MEKKQIIKEIYEAPKFKTVELSQSDVIITSPVDLSENDIGEYIGLEELW